MHHSKKYGLQMLSIVAGQHTKYSVLDKVVPGYYYRRMENGEICMSTCCNNTASEHAMCERLIIDDMVHWAKDYKVNTRPFCTVTRSLSLLQLLCLKGVAAVLDGLVAELHLLGRFVNVSMSERNQKHTQCCQCYAPCTNPNSNDLSAEHDASSIH